MASCSGNGAKGHHKFTLNVNETGTNISSNTSTVSWSLVLSPIQSGWDWNISGISYSINVDGNVKNGTIQSYNGTSTVTIASGTKTITHNSDGSKSISFGFSVTDSANKSYTCGNASSSGNLTLTKIPRQANLTSAPNFTDEENPTINYSNPAGNSVTSLQACISLTGSADDIKYRDVSKTGTSYTFELTDVERDVLRAASSTSNSLTVKFYLKTVIGSSTYHSILNKTMTIVNGNPTFSDFSYRDTNEDVIAVTGNDQVLVKGLSVLQATIISNNKMIANKKASAKNYVATIDATNVSASYSENDLNIELGNIHSTGTQRLSIRAYDSRNNSTVSYQDITVYDYDKPVINASVTRLNNFENQTILKVSGTYSKLTIDSTDKNVVTKLQYRYRETNGIWNEWKDISSTINDGEFSCEDIILSLDNTKSFEFEVQVVDNLQTSITSLILDVGEAIFFISSNKKACYINGQQILGYEIVDEW